MGRSRSRSRSKSRSRSRSRGRRRSRSYSRSRSRSSSPESYRVHVADLGLDPSKREIEKAFEKFGPLIEVWVARNPPCFAFVVYKYKEDADNAIREMDGQVLSGGRVRCSYARPRVRGARRRGGFDASLRCYQCGERGHFSRDCDEIWRQRRRNRERRRRANELRAFINGNGIVGDFVSQMLIGSVEEEVIQGHIQEVVNRGLVLGAEDREQSQGQGVETAKGRTGEKAEAEVVQGVAQGLEGPIPLRNPQEENVKKNQNLKLQNRTVQNPQTEPRASLSI